MTRAHRPKVFDQAFFQSLHQRAEHSERRRSNTNVHTSLDDPVQRLFISLMPDSYVRPHRHTTPEKWEFFWMVEGQVWFLIFDDAGTLLERHTLDAKGPCQGLEIPPNTWHSVIAIDQRATFLEVKQGPYVALDDKDFADWAPTEDSEASGRCLAVLKTLAEGGRYER